MVVRLDFDDTSADPIHQQGCSYQRLRHFDGGCMKIDRWRGRIHEGNSIRMAPQPKPFLERAESLFQKAIWYCRMNWPRLDVLTTSPAALALNMGRFW